MKLVVCERFLNVQTSKQRGKMAVGRGHPGGKGRHPWYNRYNVNPALLKDARISAIRVHLRQIQDY